MGSPINQFGNDPESGAAHGRAQYPDFWANVFGPRSQKAKGDAYPGQRLHRRGPTTAADPTVDYDSKGYFYGIEVKPDATGSLQVDAFDPAFANVARQLRRHATTSRVRQRSRRTSTRCSPSRTQPSATRPSSTSPYCTGDMYYNCGAAGTTAPARTTDRRGRRSRSWLPTTRRTTRRTIRSCARSNFPGFNANLVPALQATTPQSRRPRACSSPTSASGTAICTVKHARDGHLLPPDPDRHQGRRHADTRGQRREPVRGPRRTRRRTSRPNLRVFGEARIGIYANAPAANTTFFLARVLPGAKGRHLVMNFFDTGDAAAAGTLKILPPPDSNVGIHIHRVHVHAASGQLDRASLGNVHGHGLRLPDHRSQLGDLQRAVDPVQGPDPRRLRMQVRGRERLLDADQLRVPVERPGHHDVDRSDRGRSRAPHRVAVAQTRRAGFGRATTRCWTDARAVVPDVRPLPRAPERADRRCVPDVRHGRRSRRSTRCVTAGGDHRRSVPAAVALQAPRRRARALSRVPRVPRHRVDRPTALTGTIQAASEASRRRRAVAQLG